MTSNTIGTYSFLDVNAAIAGPGGSFALGNEAGAAEEGISVTMTEEKDTMTIGADGSGMHSLHAGKSGRVTVRLLKTSPTNAKLSQLYNLQTISSALHGQNVLSIKNKVSGDSVVATQCAFTKQPDINYAKEGGTIEWIFSAVEINESLGSGLLANIAGIAANIA